MLPSGASLFIITLNSADLNIVGALMREKLWPEPTDHNIVADVKSHHRKVDVSSIYWTKT